MYRTSVFLRDRPIWLILAIGYGKLPHRVRLALSLRPEPSRYRESPRRGDIIPYDQRRITFSEGVSASMYAGRLKMRSAYFSNGAAFFDNSMP